MAARFDSRLLVLRFWIPLAAAAAAATTAAPVPASGEQRPVLLSSFTYPETTLDHYQWSYLRVELPTWFSSMEMSFTSDVNINKMGMEYLPKSRLPLICFKYGSPPVPEVPGFEDGESSFEASQNVSSLEECLPFQTNVTLFFYQRAGVWYIGFFNGIGAERTQTKMINRGQAYTFSASININGCTTTSVWGPYCNKTIDGLSCVSTGYEHSRAVLERQLSSRSTLNTYQRGQIQLEAQNGLNSEQKNIGENQEKSNFSGLLLAENLITCNNSIGISCLASRELKYYALDVLGVTSEFMITITKFQSDQTSSFKNSSDLRGIVFMCYARYNALPLPTHYDYSGDITNASLLVNFPKIGRWYIAIQAINQSSVYQEHKICFSLMWKLYECPDGKAGVGCMWNSYMLQRIPGSDSVFSFDAYYVPLLNDGNEPMKSSEFSLEHLLSNSSINNVSWTYFFVDVPPGTAGATLHIQLMSDSNLNYEMFSRYSALPSLDSWDFLATYNYTNGSMITASDDSKGGQLDFYVPYPKEGILSLGIKHPPIGHEMYRSTLSISLEGCPRSCSSHGGCRYSAEGSGLTFYSYCWCDRDHGGFDCSVQLVSSSGHIWQSIFLIASNAAAFSPALWALRQKVFTEWVIFTSSGISSGLYHACDVGTWCALSFRVLQFMDFWLSFMAVISTFLFMTTIGDASKRAIQIGLSMTGATRTANIVLVIAFGTFGLLFGWLLEFATTFRFRSSSTDLQLNLSERRRYIIVWLINLKKTIYERFSWRFMLLGFIALASAATSWKLERSGSYWIWHSLWHISIYTSSFFFLCSVSVSTRRCNEDPEPQYELTRQNSAS